MAKRIEYNFLCTTLVMLSFICLLAAVNIYAEPDLVIYEVSGITAEDITHSERQKEVSLFDAYVLAVKNTESLPISREDLRQAQARQYQAIGSVLPRLSLQGKVALTSDDSITSQSQRTSVSLYAKQTLVTGLNELAMFKGSSHEIRIRRYELAHSAAVLLNDVALSFYQVIQMEKSIYNNNQILDLYEKMIQELNRRVAMGKSRKSEVLMTRSQMFKIKAELQSQLSELKELRLGLYSLAGIPLEASLSLGGAIPEPRYNPDDLERIIEARWDIRAAQEQIKLYNAEVLGSIGGHLPSAYLEGSYRIYQENPTANREFYGGFGFEIPLAYGEVAGNVIEKSSQKKQARLRLSKSIKEAEYEVKDSYQLWQNTTAEIESYHNALKAAEDNYQATMREYRLNLVTILDVLTALTSLQNARIDYETKVLQNRYNRIRLGVATAEFPGAGIKLLKEASVAGNTGTLPDKGEAGKQ